MSSDDVSQQKRDLRKIYQRRRLQIPEANIGPSNSSIFEKVIHLKEFEKANVIHIYASMNARNEVRTFSIMDYALKDGKRVIVPVMKGEGILKHCEIDSTRTLKKNSWGVPEPEEQSLLDDLNPDIIFVPMVAGDLQKNRLGYGKGYYDRFLASTDSLKVGLLYENQLSTEPLAHDSFDVALDILITEDRVLR